MNGRGCAENPIERFRSQSQSGAGRALEQGEEHRAPYTRKNGKVGESWWSHKAPDGREPGL